METCDSSRGLVRRAALCGALAGGFFGLSFGWHWVHRITTGDPSPSEAVVCAVRAAACVFAFAFVGTVVASFARSAITESRPP